MTPVSTDVTAAWQGLAADWLTWARTPGHDVAAWELNLPALAELLPDAGAASVDIGCGEGRVGRLLAERGHRVSGIDSSQLLADAAREAGGYQEVVCGDATALPWPENSFDLAVAFMCLMDMPDAGAAIREIARVLMPDGRLCLAIVHPFNQPEESRDDYFEEHTSDETVERNGIKMRFISRDRPLSHYTGALSAAGFVIEELREPRPPADWPQRHPRLADAYRRPFFLHIRARLVGG
jgi:SAM-dependent methyltransferase